MSVSKKTKTPISKKSKPKGGGEGSKPAQPGRAVPQGPPVKVPKQ
jgi:hypothetical protein